MAVHIFDKPLDNDVNSKPDYATEMPMSDSDSTSVSQAIANLNTAIANINTAIGTVVALATYTGSSAQIVNLAYPANSYKLLFIRLLNSDGEACATAIAPPMLMRLQTYKLFGESSSQWGSVLLSSDYNSMTCNRTSANTTQINIYGVIA